MDGRLVVSVVQEGPDPAVEGLRRLRPPTSRPWGRWRRWWRSRWWSSDAPTTTPTARRRLRRRSPPRSGHRHRWRPRRPPPRRPPSATTRRSSWCRWPPSTSRWPWRRVRAPSCCTSPSAADGCGPSRPRATSSSRSAARCSTCPAPSRPGYTEQGLLGLTFSPDGDQMFVDYVERGGDHGTTKVVRYDMAGDGVDTSSADRAVLARPAVREPQRRRGRRRPRREAVRRRRRRRVAGRSRRPRPGSRQLVRQDPAHGPRRREPHHVRVGRPQPVAVLVRPRHRRPVDRRRGRQRARGDRPPPRAAGRASPAAVGRTSGGACGRAPSTPTRTATAAASSTRCTSTPTTTAAAAWSVARCTGARPCRGWPAGTCSATTACRSCQALDPSRPGSPQVIADDIDVALVVRHRRRRRAVRPQPRRPDLPPHRSLADPMPFCRAWCHAGVTPRTTERRRQASRVVRSASGLWR